MTTIINIEPDTFGGPLRNGDMLGVANVVEHLRNSNKDPNIKFYIESHGINPAEYNKQFYEFLLEKTNYFTTIPGKQSLSWRKVNVWDFRDVCGDLVKIKNTHTKEKKIVISPLFDAPYNQYRNWPTELFLQLVKKYDNFYGEKIIVNPKPFNIIGWKDSVDFKESLKHIMTAEIYIGGDTGLSHFVGALDRGPEPIYYYSSRGLLHTTPLYWMTEKKGTMKTYWLDFEGTKWQ
jgi:ADP-heptose:LPS heptosyltransferase